MRTLGTWLVWLVRPLAILAVTACSLTVLISDAHATTIIAPTIDEMTIEADAVIVGTVERVSVQPSDEGIVRLVSVRVRELWKAECQEDVACPVEGSTLTIRARGGRGTDYATRVFGAEDYAVGEDILVFLQYTRTTDAAETVATEWHSQVLAWTKFSLVSTESEDTRAVRDIEGITPVARRADGTLEKMQIPSAHDFSLSDLRQQVDAALAASGVDE